MNKNAITRKSVETLAKAVIYSMPASNFSTEAQAKKYMLPGDDKFIKTPGNGYICGFSKELLTPDITKGTYYIAGYGSPIVAEKVLDDMFARAVYIEDGTDRGGIVMCSIDAVGISRKDINAIRRLVIESKEIPSLRSINISSTHTHCGIDTQGLWGEKIYKCGRNELFMRNLRIKAAKAIIDAYKNRTNGKLYYSVLVTEDLQADCRTPETFDKNLTKFRFASDDGKKEICIVNFASHAELLGDKTKQVSADFPAYMIKEIEENNTNTDAVFFNGAIGGMISAKEIKKVYRNEIDCEEYMKQFGKHLGELVNSMTGEKELSPLINIKSNQIKIPADNYVLILARLLNVLNNDIYRNNARSKAYIWSEVGYIELGNGEIGIFLVPGELFPELYNGEFLSAKESANNTKAEYRILSSMTDAKHHFVIGLCNDELGYIIPDNDFLLNDALPYINAAKDRFDRNHYEETNSTGRNTARIILEEFEKLLDSTK